LVTDVFKEKEKTYIIWFSVVIRQREYLDMVTIVLRRRENVDSLRYDCLLTKINVDMVTIVFRRRENVDLFEFDLKEKRKRRYGFRTSSDKENR